jgi:hypothetical protein
MDYDSEWLETDVYFDQTINHNYGQFSEGSFLVRTDQASSRFDDLSWMTPQMNDSIIPIADQGQASNNMANSYKNFPINMEQEVHQQVSFLLPCEHTEAVELTPEGYRNTSSRIRYKYDLPFKAYSV